MEDSLILAPAAGLEVAGQRVSTSCTVEEKESAHPKRTATPTLHDMGAPPAVVIVVR
jgi:hypothetical protein